MKTKLSKKQYMQNLRQEVQAELRSLYKEMQADGEEFVDHTSSVKKASLSKIVELLEVEYAWDAESIARVLLSAAVEEVDDFMIEGLNS